MGELFQLIRFVIKLLKKQIMKKITLSLLAVTLLFSCKKEDDATVPVDSTYTVPTTYNFNNVSYSGQTARLDMLDAMTTYIKTANTTGVTLDASKLDNMFANSGNPYSNPGLDTSGKQLKSKCNPLFVKSFEDLFVELETASKQTAAGSNGVAGVVMKSDGSKGYLCDAKGFEYGQLISKGLMGAVFYHSATNGGYLSNLDADNNVDVTPGKGTKREHHFDEAFGYFGAPIDFPTTGGRFWAKYAAKTQDLPQQIMDAWLKGRAAISNKDIATRNTAVTEIKALWEKAIVGAALYYISDAKAKIGDDGSRNHALSEAVAFVGCLQHNDSKVITATQIAQVKSEIGDNLWTVGIPDLTKAENTLKSIYGL